MAICAPHFAFFDLHLYVPPSTAEQICNVAHFIVLVIEFQDNRIAFPAIDARMLEEIFVDTNRILESKARIPRGVTCDIGSFISYVVLAIVCGFAWDAIAALIALFLVLTSTPRTSRHGATITPLHDNPMAQRLTRSKGIEPSTSAFGGPRSIQLSYERTRLNSSAGFPDCPCLECV